MHKPDWKTPKGVNPETLSTVCEKSMYLRRLYDSETVDGSNAEFQRLRALSDVRRHQVAISEDELVKYISPVEKSETAARRPTGKKPRGHTARPRK